MEPERAVQLQSCATPRPAEAQAPLQSPWYRRLFTGLEGRLVLCCMVLLTAALGASLWMFVSETRDLTGCLVPGGNESRVRNIILSVLLIGTVAAAVSLPAMYWLVHQVFQPIRQLVDATDRIARGDLETRVALNRSDVIGTLARSFNEMVKRVRSQQGDLARANRNLAEANARLADANEKLSGSNRDLEAKVHQRTAQVEASAKKLEGANRRLRSEIAEKEDFLRTVSHDLNAPLRNIAGMAATLLMKHRETFDEDVTRRLERICKNVEVETDLIAELLELSRIKTRRQKMETIDLNDLLRELAEVFDQDLETRRIRLIVDSPLPSIYCERARMRQIFQNLIDNAIKYMGGQLQGTVSDGAPPLASNLNPGPQTLTPSIAKPREIHVGCVAQNGEAEFYVRDTGMGIAPEDLEKVFHVFRRGSSEAVQGVAGKGVGLASVKSIVETYSGTIWVESELGAGAIFRFTINGEGVPGRFLDESPALNGEDAEYTRPAA